MGSNKKPGSAANITLEKFDDLFGDNAAQGNGGEQITHAKLADLHTFKGHPFRVLDDEKMEETTESISKYGVLVPGIARPREGGGYEIIAGHRRKRGSELAGLDTMPVIVRNYTDDEATIIMVDSNIQREDILPSEKAKAYAMKYEAMKHQGSGRKEDRNIAGSGYFLSVRGTAAVCGGHSSGNGSSGFQRTGGKAERVWKKRRAYACDGAADTDGRKNQREKGNNQGR